MESTDPLSPSVGGHTGARSQKKSPQYFLEMNFLNIFVIKPRNLKLDMKYCMLKVRMYPKREFPKMLPFWIKAPPALQ